MTFKNWAETLLIHAATKKVESEVEMDKKTK